MHDGPNDRYLESGMTRREFFRRAAMMGVALPSAAAILAACGSDSDSETGSGSGTTALPLARPDNPITLPISEDNPAIADGLDPESGPLRIFGYNDYIWKKVRNGFGEKYGVDVEYTVFDTPEEMVAKVQSNGADFDLIVTVTIENVGKLAQGKLIQPLNKTYLPTAQEQLWPEVPDFYDVGRQYTMPYVIFTTGVAWRNDLVTEDIGGLDNPYDVYWDTKYKGKVHLLNGARDTLAVGLLQAGYDPNEADPTILDTVKQHLLEGADEMGWKFDHVDYTELSTSQWEIHNTWSGQMVYYQYYLPKDVKVTDLSYAWPPQTTSEKAGLISHDLFSVTKGAQNPVLAHAMIDYIYEGDNALQNYTYEGYQPPLLSLDLDTAVAKGYLPESLDYTFVTPDMIPLGVTEMELEPATTQLYQQIYQEITGGA